MPMTFLCLLVLAHFLGDFYFQPSSWIKRKRQKGIRSVHLWLHALIHGALSLLVIATIKSPEFWLWAVVIAVLHGLTDQFKSAKTNSEKPLTLFVADQFVHLAVILVAWIAIEQPPFKLEALWSRHLLVLIGSILIVTRPASMLIREFMSRWKPHLEGMDDSTLESAGKYIGMLERLFVFTFVVMGQWEAIGFLIAAKSLLRYGDIQSGGDRRLTEYILIGTLFSLAIAIATGLIAKTILRI